MLVVANGSTLTRYALTASQPPQSAWAVDVGFSVGEVKVLPTPNSAIILVSHLQGTALTAVDAATRGTLWTAANVGLHTTHAHDIYGVLYTDSLRYPHGAPNLGGGPTADVLLLSSQVTPRTTYLVDGGTGQVIWSRVEPADTRGFQFLPTSAGSYDVVFASESQSMPRVDGATGQTIVWARPLQHRWGVPVPDVSGDGQPDFLAAPSYWSSTVRLLSGATGTDVWTHDYGAFDVLGGAVVQDHLGLGALVSAQNSYAGGVRRYRAENGAIVWTCPAAYNNNTMVGLLRRANGLTVLSGWRHQYRAIALDAATGAVLWDHVPASNADFIGVGVRDLNGDGHDDLLAQNNSIFRLHCGLTGSQLDWFPAIPGQAAAFYVLPQPPPEPPAQAVLCVGDAAGNVHVLQLDGTPLNTRGVLAGPIGNLDLIDVDGGGVPELLVTSQQSLSQRTVCLKTRSLSTRWTTSHPTRFEFLGHDDFGARIYSGDFDSDGELELMIPLQNFDGTGKSRFQVFNATTGQRECVLDDGIDWLGIVYFDPVDSTWRLAVERNPDAFTHYLYNYTLSGCPMQYNWGNTSVNTWKLGAIGQSEIDGMPRIWGGWYGRTLYVVDRAGNTRWAKSFGGTYEAEAVYAKQLCGNSGEVLLVGGTYGTNHVRLDAARLSDGATLWTFNDPTADWVVHVVAVGDVNGDGVQEIYIRSSGNASRPAKYQALNGCDGTRIWQVSYPYTAQLPVHGRLVDVTGDGVQELLVAVDNRIEARHGLTGALVRTYTFPALVNAFELADLPAFDLGDLNCDGSVDFDDIDAFMLALNSGTSYHATYPDCERALADCNGDGYVDFDDIDFFVALLSADHQ